MGSLNDLEKLEGQVDRLIAEQASGWVQIMRNPSAQNRVEFARWLKKNERHASEYLLMEALDRNLEGLDAERRHSVADLLANTSAVTSISAAAGNRKKQRRWAHGLAAAALGAVAVTAWWLSPLSGRNWQEMDTRVGEQRVFQLDDGSRVHLNTHSRLRVRFSAHARELQLLSGEAFFDVAADAHRPFRVKAGQTTVRALGTQFNVYLKTAATEVAVLEGKVEVSRSDAAHAPSSPTLLSAGEKARIVTGGPVSKRSGEDVIRSTAWQQRRLMFRLDSLTDIAAEFNRYNRAPRIVVEGEAIQARQFSGVFDADRPQDFAQMVAGDESLAVEHTGGTIVIHAR